MSQTGARLPSMMTENFQFNRRETQNDHIYHDRFGFREIGSKQHKGLLKAKLLHGKQFSTVVPEVIFLGGEAERWIQPLAYFASQIQFFPGDSICRLYVDISCGQTIRIDFLESAISRTFTDGSELYQCTISGPDDLLKFTTGRSEQSEGSFWLELFHHTTPDAKDAIISSGHFRLSSWNIQGTKKLTNVGYVYFTPLDTLKFDSDLKCISMATDGEITLVVDGINPSPVSTPETLRQLNGKVLRMKVYRESTSNRTATLRFWIDVAALGPQHVLRHAVKGEAVFYEVSSPFIHRVGMPVGGTLDFSSTRIRRTEALKKFDYVVMGDARIISGLAAPFDEEDTRHVMKVVRSTPNSNLFRFWQEHANTDTFTSQEVELQQFGK